MKIIATIVLLCILARSTYAAEQFVHVHGQVICNRRALLISVELWDWNFPLSKMKIISELDD